MLTARERPCIPCCVLHAACSYALRRRYRRGRLLRLHARGLFFPASSATRASPSALCSCRIASLFPTRGHSSPRSNRRRHAQYLGTRTRD